jgi:hypothetical protein
VRVPSSIGWLGLGVVLFLVVEGCSDSGDAATQNSPLGDASVRDDGAPPGKGDGGSGQGGGGSSGKLDSGTGTGGSAGSPGGRDSGSGAGGAVPVNPVWDASGPSTTDDACSRLADAICKRTERCSLYNLRLNFGDVATCSTRYAATCRAEIAAPGTGTTVSSLNRCANYASASDCSDFAAAACYPQPGQRLDGEACRFDSQCAGRHCAFAIAGALCGTCAREPSLGEACTRTCDYGLTCFEGLCVPVPLLGMTCTAQLECAGSLRCVAPGVCAPQLGLGEPCVSYASGQCNLSQGLECNRDTDTCAPYNELAGPGQPCGAATATFPRTGCLAGASCPTTTNDAGVRTCVARLQVGDPCGSATPNNAGCGLGLRCESGACTVPDATDCQ